MGLQTRTGSFQKYLYQTAYLFVFTLICFVIVVDSVHAGETGSVTFTWQANPSEDNVIGYRLYYGAKSRFDTDGRLKENFIYEYSIDFTTFIRCELSQGENACIMMNEYELQCDNLFGDKPKCTVSNLHGPMHFALTAYNAQAESSYTSELSLLVNQGGLAAVQHVNNILLLDKNN